MPLLTEWVAPKWQRRRGLRRVHLVAVLCAVLAAGGVLAMFNAFGILPTGAPDGERQLIATVDLRLGTPALAAERGAARARVDLEAGELKLQAVGPAPSKAETARAARIQQRYGVVWAHWSEQVTPETTAYVQAYNRVMRAEIERRHGKAVAEGLLGFEDAAPGGAPASR